jgi:hypothetical protein
MEPEGNGSFQAVKLRRPTRITVRSHSTRDMAAMLSLKNNETWNEILYSIEQL